MATRGYTCANPLGGIKIVVWSGLLNGDDGTPFICAQFADKSIQVTGTFGVNGTITIEGTNFEISPVYATLNDPQGNPLTITIAKIEQILENTYQVRPTATGDGNTNLVVRMLVSTPTEYSNHIPDSP